MTNNNIYQSHRHSLEEFDCGGDTYPCDGCKTMGIGTGYRCSKGCDYKLHIECKRACSEIEIEGQTCVFYEIPPRGKKCSLPRKEKYCTKCRTCNACKKDVKGFVYHCSKTGWDFHPSCARISIDGVTFSLKKDGPSECAVCELLKKKQPKGDEKKSSAIEKEKKSSGDEKKSPATEKVKKSSGDEKKIPAIKKEKKSSGDEKKSPAIEKVKKSSGDEKKSSAIKKEKKNSGDEKESPVIEKEVKSSGDEKKSSAIKKEKRSSGDEKKSSAIKKEKKSSGDEKGSPVIEKEVKSSGDEKKSSAIKKEKRSSGDEMKSTIIEEEKECSGNEKKRAVVKKEKKSSGDEKKSPAIEKEKKSSGDEKKVPAIENGKESSCWSYVSDDNEYSLHVNCAMNLYCLNSSTSSKSNKGDSFLTIVERMEHLKIESKNGGSKSSNKWLKMLKFLLKTVISIISIFVGDPTTLIVSAIDLWS